MRTVLKIFSTALVFSAFYAGAFLVMSGAKEFEKSGEVALFTNKAEAAAIANAERDKDTMQAVVAPSVWK